MENLRFMIKKELCCIAVVDHGVIYNNTMKLTIDKHGYRVRILASLFLI